MCPGVAGLDGGESSIALIGANGSVGQAITRTLLFGMIPSLRELTLIARSRIGRDNLISLCEDSLPGIRGLTTKVTDDPLAAASADIVLFAAGTSVTQDLRDPTQASGSNRVSLLDQNTEVLQQYLPSLSELSNNQLLCIITNPVSHLVRLACINLSCSVVGIGTGNDTLRMQAAFKKRFGWHPYELFAIGEHGSYTDLAYTYSQLPEFDSNKLFDNDKLFRQGKKRKEQFTDLRTLQTQMLIDGQTEKLFEISESLPLEFEVYLRHRAAHFISKTIMSTTLAVINLIQAAQEPTRSVSAEVLLRDNSSGVMGVAGVPIHFENSHPRQVSIDLSNYERTVIQRCVQRFKI